MSDGRKEVILCQRCGKIFAGSSYDSITPEWKNKVKQYKENGCEVRTITVMSMRDWCDCDKPKTKGDKTYE